MTKQQKTSPWFRRYLSVKMVFFLALFAVAFLHLVSSVPAFYRSVQKYQLAREIEFFNTISDQLYTAVGNYGFERGRVNVVLSDAGSVAGMEENRAFILARRHDGDEALKDALTQLMAWNIPQASVSIASIQSLSARIADLRGTTGKELLLPKERRTPGLAEIWFAAMTEYIESITTLLVSISDHISDADGMISRLSSLKYETLNLRNTAGPEMSILTATMASGTPLKAGLAQKIETLQARTTHHFQSLDTLSQPLEDKTIPQALAELQQVYFEEYRPYRESVFSLAAQGGPYPYSQTEFLQQGVLTLQQIASFMSTIVDVTHGYAEAKVSESIHQIVILCCTALGSLVLIVLIFLYTHFRVIHPIGQVTSSVRRLSQRDLQTHVPFQDEPNEIGEMARAVEVFKKMSIQLDKDVSAHESASAERERFIRTLQQSVDDAQVAREIHPICSICKSIRNKEGDYEQLEEFFHKNMGMNFSHTICSPCMEKFYPEEYQAIRAKKEKGE